MDSLNAISWGASKGMRFWKFPHPEGYKRMIFSLCFLFYKKIVSMQIISSWKREVSYSMASSGKSQEL